MKAQRNDLCAFSTANPYLTRKRDVVVFSIVVAKAIAVALMTLGRKERTVEKSSISESP